MSDARAKLLAGIRKGIILKKFITPSHPPEPRGLVGALSQALAQRKLQLHNITG